MDAALDAIDTGSGGGAITNANALSISSPSFGTTVPTIVEGVALQNQGAAGETTAVGLDLQAQTGATTDIGLRIAKSTTYSLQLSDTGGTAAGGIEFGTDTDLYRSAANTLTTDDSLTVALASTFNSTVSIQGANSLNLGSTTNVGSEIFKDGTADGFTATLQAPTLTGNVSLSLPSSAPGLSQCLQSGAVTASLLVFGTCSSNTIGTIDSQTPSANGATIIGSVLYLQSGSATNPGLINTTTQTIAGAKTFTGATTVNNSSSTAFLVQSAGNAALTVDTTGNEQVIIGNGGNTITLSGNPSTGNSIKLAGNARIAKRITLTAEYAGAVLDGLLDSPNDIGTMSSGINSGSANPENFYTWTTAQSTNQSYDVVVQIPLPSDWAAWAASSPITVDTETTDTTNGTITGTLTNTSGSVDTNWNTCSLTPSSTATWTHQGL